MSTFESPESPSGGKAFRGEEEAFPREEKTFPNENQDSSDERQASSSMGPVSSSISHTSSSIGPVSSSIGHASSSMGPVSSAKASTAIGSVILAATPIGDAEDAPPRLLRMLGQATVIAAEDTRRLHALAGRIGATISGRVVSYHEHNESARSEELLNVVRNGGTVLVVTDAGMPVVSDPGYRIVVDAVAAGLPVTAIPGPSAVLTALAVAGLPTDRFCFDGFVPRKAGDRARFLASLRDEPRTMVFFESPHRLAVTLEAMADPAGFGPERPGAICRELTKTYEEVIRGPLAELSEWSQQANVRGEITLVIAGAIARNLEISDVVSEVLARVDAGERLKTVVDEVATAADVSKRELYQAALVARKK